MVVDYVRPGGIGGAKDVDILSFPASRTSIDTAVTTVAIAGTAQQMPALVIPNDHNVVIKALGTNIAPIHIADTAAKAIVDANAFELDAGEVIELRIDNLNRIFIDANVNGEGVTHIVED